VTPKQIPIENIYFLLCYAWNHLQELKYSQVRSENCRRLGDLLAKVLIRASQQLVKRGLHRNYVSEIERRLSPKGKIVSTDDVRRPSWTSPARTFEFDNLSADVLPNRIIRASFDILRRHGDLADENRRGLREASKVFSDFEPFALRSHHFRRVHLNGNMRHYRFVLNVCELIRRESIPSEDPGTLKFRDFERDEARMGELFQQFVRNFYKKEQTKYRVSAPGVDWDVDPGKSSPAGVHLLPSMQTDICLEGGTEKLIIECKFYREAFQYHYGTKKFLSAHLYQLFAYLRNQAVVPGWQSVSGMLLYPTNGFPIDEFITIQGHRIRVVALDLGQAWQKITDDLLKLANPS
jgi:5-methylcytosine-specific restriction enzyme subunit McrC